MKKLLPAIFSLLLILVCASYLYLHPKDHRVIERTDGYVASANYSVPVYREEDHLLYKYADLTRGTHLTNRNQNVEVNGGDFIFTEVELDGETNPDGSPIVYYISSSNICDKIEDAVRADTLYVRTPVTVYASSDSAEIASFLPKGSEVSISGYAGLQEDGSVEMFRIANPGCEGYVFAKYLVDTKEEALADYAPVADIHAGRYYDYNLYGGYPESLDWYPFEKPVLSQGPPLDNAKAIYLNMEAMKPGLIDSYITLAKDAGANAFIIDIKNTGLTCDYDAAASMCPTGNERAYMSQEDFAKSMKKVQDSGIYMVGRIVVFRDPAYAADHPEDCIVSTVTEQSWPSAYSRNCWYYNLSLALEAVHKYGFQEIQFDYVRFPENAFAMSENGYTDYRNTYGEEKAQAIQNFCIYAADLLHREGVYLSVDVFGECINEYVTAYGQYWPAISNVVDVISGMPYTDHFGSEIDTWSYPYDTIYDWANKAKIRQTEIETPAIARTWITGYDTPNWNPEVVYGSAKLLDQAMALYDSGLGGGFIPWNANSDISKYYSYMDVWKRQY